MEQVNSMDTFYTQLCEKSHFDKSTVEAALCFAKKCNMEKLSDLLFEEKPEILENKTVYFMDGFYPHSFFTLAREEIKKNGLCDETGFLYIYITLAKKAFHEFTELGFSDSVFFDTVSGIASANIYHRNETGNDGIYDYLWLSGHLRANVIRLGSFEYQNGIFSFDEAPYLNGKSVKSGDPAVFLHIPFGTDFSKCARLDSYMKASEIFGESVLVCDSWLLYPENAKTLSEQSNIRSFAEDFYIFHIDENNCFEDLHRIFGKNCDFSDIESLPAETELQRIYISRLKNRLPSGSGAGIRIL